MCFSATASFTAGTTLSLVGVAAIGQVRRRAELPLALIPLLFGVQQLVEGVVWLTFTRNSPALARMMTYAYSVFSHVLWPVYVPFAFRFLETVPWRRRAMGWFLVAGVAVGLYLLYFIVTRPVVAQVDRHIVYVSPHFYIVAVMAFYLASTCVTGFLSSHPFLRMFSVLALLSFIASYLFHARALVSVWCFFAAILSVLIFLHLRFRQLGGFPQGAARDTSRPLLGVGASSAPASGA